MLHAGLDLSRKRLEVCLLGDDGAHLDQVAVAPDGLGDSVLRLGRIRVTGRTSGVEMESEFTQHVVVRDGLIVSSRDYLSHAEALEAAVLEE